ncbi:hypothetical protein [Nocardiopsis alba]|uniref:hypothetical protein n=1 Tax=Nocardiopsis alba TaxID=53437 RepID=UPI0033ABBEF8
MPDIDVLTAFAAALPDPDTAPSPWWTGPERDRTELKRALGIHKVRDRVTIVGRLEALEAGVRTAARLASTQQDGPVKVALEELRWELEESWEMARAERWPRPALWPPKPGDTWKELSTGRLWKGAWDRNLCLALVATDWKPTDAHCTTNNAPEEVWETFGPFQFVSGLATDEHPYTQVVRELLEWVPWMGGQGGAYERELLKLQGAGVDDASAHRRLVEVMRHRGADDDICEGCAVEELSEDELDDPWVEKPGVGECPVLNKN